MFPVDRTAFGVIYALRHLAVDVSGGPKASMFTSIHMIKTAETAQR
jgi:hypothetical protein